MAKRFLEVEIFQVHRSSINLVVDDQDPKYQSLFDKDRLKLTGSFRSLHDPVQLAAKKAMHPTDWEPDQEVEVDGYKEITQEEAVLYATWDVEKKELFK